MFSQPGRPSRMSRAIASRSPRVACALERRLGAARLRPAGQQAREQRRAGAVGVLVEGESMSPAAASISSSSGSISWSPRERLQMREVQRRAGAPGDVDQLADRLEQSVALVPDMRDERHAERRGLLGHRDELVGLGVGARDVDEPEREHPRARLEPEPHLAPHLGQLLGRRRHRGRRRARPRAPRRARPTARGVTAGRVCARVRRGTRRTSSRATPAAPHPRAPAGTPAAPPARPARPAPAPARPG